MFSRRSRLGGEVNRLTLAVRARRRDGLETLDLTCGNPTQAGLLPDPALLRALADAEGLRYEPDPRGMPVARQAVAAWLSEQGPVAVAPEQVLLTASTSEAYAYLFKLLCDPGDRVLVPRPSYPLFEHLCQLEGVVPAPYPLHYDGLFHIDRAALEAARNTDHAALEAARRTDRAALEAARDTDRDRAVLMVHPNNPTGSLLRRDDLAHLASLGLPLISDEVFAPYPLAPGRDAASSAREASEALVFTLHGLSKLAGLPQLKLSWICVTGPADAAREALRGLELIADTFLSVSTPVQLALPAILDEHAPRLRAAIHARLLDNHAWLQTACAGSAATPLRVEGGWYAVLRLPALMDDEGWALHLLDRAGVLLQPGYFYDFETGPHLVASLLTPEAELRAGIGRLLEQVAEAGG